MKEDELKALKAILDIIHRGNSAEVKQTTDGQIRIYEVKKAYRIGPLNRQQTTANRSQLNLI